jgi:hypothetical protein
LSGSFDLSNRRGLAPEGWRSSKTMLIAEHQEKSMRLILSSVWLRTICAATVALTATGFAISQSSAAPSAMIGGFSSHGVAEILLTPVVMRRGGAVRTRTAVGPRGGVYHSRTAVRGGVARPGVHGGGVRWARPAHYGWPRGGAIAAGAAIGMVTAATAAAWAGAAPAPGMCWYYTDPSRTQGFWDYCR